MQKKHLFLSVLGVLLLAFSFSYSLVFALPYTGEVKYEMNYLSDNIIINSQELQKNKIVVKSHKKVKNFSVTGDCGAFGEILGSKDVYTIVEVGIKDTSCSKDKIEMSLQLDDFTFQKKYNLIADFQLYEQHLDRSDANLSMFLDALEQKLVTVGSTDNGVVPAFQQERLTKELVYMRDFFQNILEKRKQIYKIPVAGAPYPTGASKVPDAARPYRAAYTDGIHHGWDFDGKMGDSVIALDDGIVIRVVEGFLFSDLGNLKKDGDLTYEDKIKNLDILRGNQIWVKTMKGDVAFYSHLDTVFPDIKVGDIVKRGQPLGTMGITGVPDKNYTDYHLHIAIQKNPYLNSKIGKNTDMDYMMWDWSFKGKGVSYALNHKKELFIP